MNVATRGQERQYGDADQIEAKVNEWLTKIDVNEVLTYIEKFRVRQLRVCVGV